VSYSNGSFYGEVNKFLKVTVANTTLRLALITVYTNLPPSPMGVIKINHNKPYKADRIIEVSSIERKVMLVGGPNPTYVLPTPHKRSV